MTINERMREVRKCSSINLTVEAFGSRLGVSKSTISNLENGNRELTPQMVKSICREFGVSESWLRTGEGEMFAELSRSEQIAAFFNNVSVDEGFKKRFVSVLAQFNESEWLALEQVVRSIMEKYNGKPEDGEDPAADSELTIDELEDQYKKEHYGSASRQAQ